MNAESQSAVHSKPLTIVVGGFSSEVGKTTLMCELLPAFAGWEAIKLSRGHYRSCGRDPQTCCVGHLLRDEPVILSGRDQNYSAGKDTGRFWDAGAANVHWVIATDEQVEEGIRLAVERVRGRGVLIEGNSPIGFIDADFAVMVARAEGGKVKPTARRALPNVDALYLSGDLNGSAALRHFDLWKRNPDNHPPAIEQPVFSKAELPLLVACIREKLLK